MIRQAIDAVGNDEHWTDTKTQAACPATLDAKPVHPDRGPSVFSDDQISAQTGFRPRSNYQESRKQPLQRSGRYVAERWTTEWCQSESTREMRRTPRFC